MVDDWSNVALRFAVYVDLMVLFGLPLFAASAFDAADQCTGIRRRHERLAAAAAVLGALLSILALLAMAKQMAGAADYTAVTGHMLQMVLTRTGAGISWVVRAVALAVCLAAAVALRGRSRQRFVVLAWGGAVALATLAWTGHGAMDEGTRGFVHLASDILHLIAAGAWVGALVAFVTVSSTRDAHDAEPLQVLGRTATGFARIGTAIVLAVAITGTINYLMTIGPSIHGLVSTAYGRLLSAKLVLFAGMLALAAANRYRLAPGLQRSLLSGDAAQAGRALRRSLRFEAGLGLLVLALVSWLGTLSPDA